MKTEQHKIINRARVRFGHEGFFVLENAHGATVRTFNWSDAQVMVVYRHDNRRIETHASVAELESNGIKFDVLANTTREALKAQPLKIGTRGTLRWSPEIAAFSPAYDLNEDEQMKSSTAFGWSIFLQALLAALFVLAGFFSGSKVKTEPEVTVTMLPQEAVEKLLEQAKTHTPAVIPPAAVQRQSAKSVVVAPRATKIDKNEAVPVRSTRTLVKKAYSNGKVRGGGYKGEGPRGYGTNEPHMNQIGALGALNNAPRVRGGNGGAGGINLRAVGTEPGSGAGGRGFGGFGANGGGGRGKGGLGRGSGSGLANAMYGKGLIAAPFGDGSPAPGAGGYGTRGKAGGGAQGAGYGTETVVGSWKGTGPKGDGPAGSGVGNGDPNGSPWGASDGSDDEALVTGGLDEDQINQVINRNLGQIRYCYELGLQKQARLQGRVVVRFNIAGTGSVSTASVKNSTVRSAQVESCIVSKLRTWKFPKPHGGVTVAVVYPFNLNRTVGLR